MSGKRLKIAVLPAFLLVFFVLPATGYGTDNATITGDGVRLRAFPSANEGIVMEFKNGTRVEALSQSDFTDTIDGCTARWYCVQYEEGYRTALGFVFGCYVAVDRGVTVPPLLGGTGYDYMIMYFVWEGITAFGDDRAAVINNLGRPISETTESYEYEGKIYKHLLTYDGLVVETLEDVIWLGCVASVTVTNGAYNFCGLKVGSPVSDLERIFGPRYKFSYSEDSVGYGVGSYYFVSFKVKDDKITQIEFTYERCGD
jgi:hypothetical protein